MVAVALAVTLILIVKGRQPVKPAGLTAFSVSNASVALVQLSGDVIHPGIYVMIDNKLTNSVINMSMPRCAEQLSLQPAKLSIPIQSGSTIEIICKSPDNRLLIDHGAMKSSQLLTLGLPLDLNQVTESDLELLPGIGPTLARRIVDYRQKNGVFNRVNELIQVEGIGEKKYKLLSRYFK